MVGERNESLIRLLKHLLTQAEAGELVAIAVAGLTAKGENISAQNTDGTTMHRLALAGALEVTRHMMAGLLTEEMADEADLPAELAPS